MNLLFSYSDLRYTNRYHPTKDPGMVECIKQAARTLAPPIVVPWNPKPQNQVGHRGGRGGYRGNQRGHRGRGGHKRRNPNDRNDHLDSKRANWS